MRNLLLFLKKYGYLLLFVAYQAIAITLYIRAYHFQRNTIINSCNFVTGAIYSSTGHLLSYLFVRGENLNLNKQVAQLQDENRLLRETLEALSEESFSTLPTTKTDSLISYESVLSRVINNSVGSAYNHITLNKGRADGILPDMGVVSEAGIVGVVLAVSEHYSTVISVLNQKMKVSSKLKNGEFFGSLSWDDVSDPRYAHLNDIPRHAVFAKGDTVITSGFSTIFPEGIIIGVVEGDVKQTNDNFYNLKIKLTTDFHSLYHVRVLTPKNAEERVNLEQNNAPNDK